MRIDKMPSQPNPEYILQCSKEEVYTIWYIIKMYKARGNFMLNGVDTEILKELDPIFRKKTVLDILVEQGIKKKEASE